VRQHELGHHGRRRLASILTPRPSGRAAPGPR
jgi:hypothetical protein